VLTTFYQDEEYDEIFFDRTGVRKERIAEHESKLAIAQPKN
jgi:hypothetical protein